MLFNDLKISKKDGKNDVRYTMCNDYNINIRRYLNILRDKYILVQYHYPIYNNLTIISIITFLQFHIYLFWLKHNTSYNIPIDSILKTYIQKYRSRPVKLFQVNSFKFI